jgi:hypothetical protein
MCLVNPGLTNNAFSPVTGCFRTTGCCTTRECTLVPHSDTQLRTEVSMGSRLTGPLRLREKSA